MGTNSSEAIYAQEALVSSKMLGGSAGLQGTAAKQRLPSGAAYGTSSGHTFYNGRGSAVPAAAPTAVMSELLPWVSMMLSLRQILYKVVVNCGPATSALAELRTTESPPLCCQRLCSHMHIHIFCCMLLLTRKGDRTIACIAHGVLFCSRAIKSRAGRSTGGSWWGPLRVHGGHRVPPAAVVPRGPDGRGCSEGNVRARRGCPRARSTQVNHPQTPQLRGEGTTAY